MSEVRSSSYERHLTDAERAVASLRIRLLDSRGLAHLSDHCTAITLRTGSVGIKITDEVVIVNSNGDPGAQGSTAYSFDQEGVLSACEAATSTRTCDDSEVAQFTNTLSELGDPSVRGELCIELSYTTEQ